MFYLEIIVVVSNINFSILVLLLGMPSHGEEKSYNSGDMLSSSSSAKTIEEGGQLSELAVNSMEDVSHLNWNSVRSSDLKNCHFLNREIAFELYNFYGRLKGISVRKSHVARNKKREIVRQDLVCHKEGFCEEEKKRKREDRKREPKVESRWLCCKIDDCS